MERTTKVRTLLATFLLLLALAVVASWNAFYWVSIALLLAAAATAGAAGQIARN